MHSNSIKVLINYERVLSHTYLQDMSMRSKAVKIDMNIHLTQQMSSIEAKLIDLSCEICITVTQKRYPQNVTKCNDSLCCCNIMHKMPLNMLRIMV